MTINRALLRGSLLFMVAIVVAVLTGCGSDDDTTTGETSSSVTTNAEPTTSSAPSTSAEPETSSTPEFESELFVTDDGVGCAVYVSVSESVGEAAPNQREMIWTALVDKDFQGCEPTELGLLTVDELDEYDQPDWAQVVEHGYFEVSEWGQLVDSCFELPISTTCSDLLGANLSE